jgi:hypothetical protein
VELIDFSAGFPTAEQIKSAGFDGAILYFADPRASFLKAKPTPKRVVDEYLDAGLTIVANYQYGKGETSDWMAGYEGGLHHANRMKQILKDAGLEGVQCAKYGPVDSNPTLSQHNRMIAPFFKGWESVFGHEWSGAYANNLTIEWLIEDGLCSYFWQHGWDGRPSGTPLVPNPNAHILQYEIDKRQVGGIGIDRNRTLKPTFGQVVRRVEVEPVLDDWAAVNNQWMGPGL